MRHAYGNANGDAHIHADGDCDGNCHIHSDSNCDGNCHISHADSDSDCDCDCYGYGHGDRYSNGYSNCDRTVAAFTDAATSADAAAACEQLL
jgi:hypothetical protein